MSTQNIERRERPPEGDRKLCSGLVEQSTGPEQPEESLLVHTCFFIYGSKTLIWNPLADRAIVIEDEIVTAMFKQIFNFLWAKTQ